MPTAPVAPTAPASVISQESSSAETAVSFAFTVASPMYAFVVLSKRSMVTVESKATDFALPPAVASARFLATVSAATFTFFSEVTDAPPSM